MITPKPRQKPALDILNKFGYVYLYWSVGSGKTLMSIYAIKQHWIERKKRVPSLYITAASAFTSFREACYENGLSDEHFDILDTKEKRDHFLFRPIKDNKSLICMSYDKLRDKDFMYMKPGLWRDQNTMPKGRLADIQWEFLVLDEAHSLKSGVAKQTKNAKGFCHFKSIKKKILASGTPIGKDQRDLFNQIYILDNGKRLGKNQYFFEQEYFYDRNYARRGTESYKPWIIIKEGAKDKLYKKITDIYNELDIKEKGYAKLPDKTFHKIVVKKTKEQIQLQRVLEDTATIEFHNLKKDLENKKIKTIQYYSKVLSQLAVLRQLCCGFVYKTQEIAGVKKRSVMRVPTNKVEKLKKGLLAIPKEDKIIIWTVYRETYAIIEELLQEIGFNYVKITGRIPIKKREGLINDFQKKPEVRVFLSHPKAGGVGLNLPQAKWGFYYSKDYSLIDKLQSEGRNLRLNSIEYNKMIHEIDIVTEGTIETKITHNIKKKKDIVNEFAEYLRGRR